MKQYRAAIVASLFETFCLAAHEMHQAGLPLIIVERPVFSAFFKSQVFLNCIFLTKNILNLKKKRNILFLLSIIIIHFRFISINLN